MLKNYEQVAQELRPHLQGFEDYRTKMIAKTLERKLLILAYVVFLILVAGFAINQRIEPPIAIEFIFFIIVDLYLD